jgi:hypothetical protein
MLFVRVKFQGHKTQAPLRLASNEARPAGDFLVSKADYPKGLDGEILLAFKWHKVKLRFLAFLLEYLEFTIPIPAKKERPVNVAQELHGAAFDVKLALGAPNIDATLKLIRSYRREFLTEIGEIKERGLYVNVSESGGDLISPGIQTLPTRLLMELAAFLIATL